MKEIAVSEFAVQREEKYIVRGIFVGSLLSAWARTKSIIFLVDGVTDGSVENRQIVGTNSEYRNNCIKVF